MLSSNDSCIELNLKSFGLRSSYSKIRNKDFVYESEIPESVFKFGEVAWDALKITVRTLHIYIT